MGEPNVLPLILSVYPKKAAAKVGVLLIRYLRKMLIMRKVEILKPAKCAAVKIKELLRASRVLVAVKKVNPPNSAVAPKKDRPIVMVGAVTIRPIPRLHVPGRDRGRSNEANGVEDIIELA